MQLALLNAILLILLLATPTKLVSSPCCGGSGDSIFGLISGDELRQLGMVVSYGEVLGNVDANGRSVFLPPSEKDSTQTLRLFASTVVLDRFQLGGWASLVRRVVGNNQQEDAHVGLGDSHVNMAYEAVPDWTYSVWRPKGFAFLNLTLPTGSSIYEQNVGSSSDVTGRGFWELALGMSFTKSWGELDVLWAPQLKYFFSRATALGYEIQNGVGASALLGVGYSSFDGRFRIGLSLTPTWEKERLQKLNAVESVMSSMRLLWNTSFNFGLKITDDTNVVASISDPSLIGPAKTTVLERVYALSATYRFNR